MSESVHRTIWCWEDMFNLAVTTRPKQDESPAVLNALQTQTSWGQLTTISL